MSTSFFESAQLIVVVKCSPSPGAVAFDLKAAGFDFSPAQSEPDKSFPDKIRQQLQVLRDLNLLEFLGSGSYRLH